LVCMAKKQRMERQRAIDKLCDYGCSVSFLIVWLGAYFILM